MARIATFLWVAMSAALPVARGAASGGERGLAVMSEVVSASTTQDVPVLAPQAKGTWPVVIVLDGIGGSGQDNG